jgi:hypothetical protein
MSMMGYVRRISPAEALALERKPTSIRRLLRGGYDMKAMIRDQLQGKTAPKRAAMEAAYARAKQISDQLKRSDRGTGPATLEEIQKMTRPLREAGAFGEDTDVLELDKSWHTLHYLLTGSAEATDSALGRAILGGKEIGPDVGHGPARLLTVAQVQEIAIALAKVPSHDLAQRFDLGTMIASEIYACRDEGELDLAQEYFEQLKSFYADSAARGSAILLYVR